MDYDKIVFDTYKNKDVILDALKTVRAFVANNKLLLTGGMATDFALKSIGHPGIYDGETLPDYDFFTPIFHTHAYELGYELCKSGMSHVDIINAIHVLTMKVRVAFDVVADITYISDKIASIMPYIEYEGIRVIHPHFIMITQYASLSRPYDNAPREVIMNRWGKDMQRLSLLDENFPVAPPKSNIKTITRSYTLPHSESKTSTTTVKETTKTSYCLSGWPALSYWMNKLTVKNGVVTYEAPRDANVHLLTTDIDAFIDMYDADSKDHESKSGGKSKNESESGGKSKSESKSENDEKSKIEYMQSFMDLIPRSIIVAVPANTNANTDDGAVRIFDTFGMKISAFYDEKLELWIVTPMYILCQLLVDIIYYNDEASRLGYVLLRDIVYKKATEVASKGAPEINPILPYPYVYGDIYFNANYLAQLNTFLREVSHVPTGKVNADFSIPATVHLDSSCVIPDSVADFDVKASLFFQSDYQKSKPFRSLSDRIVPLPPHVRK